ncbi:MULTISPECIES: EAL domain-containing protein [Halomonadaceae]|uniref:Diguanylate cyclase (GGDEF)-like protein n=1 Tax=Onishia taeanensis TaxID=284577 RepID=A0A328XTU8_9GAMM|nr:MULTISPECIES: EAL domain-containing protein [Halomonas]RAR63120.1 diguanylate cyclase (GGDEF)-like protein [Halomonas taeanensis]
MTDDTALTHKRLLVVDDNPANVELLLDLLDDHGFENVTSTSDSSRVVSLCEADCPDLILLDIRMPGLDGHGVMSALTERFDSQAPPVIVLTAQHDHETRQTALSLGARDFLTKPFRHDEVLQRINNVLSVQHRFEVRDQQAEALEHLVSLRTQALERQTRTDPTTDLPNRHGLSEVLEQRATLSDPTGILFIALDELDDIVRLHGYSAIEGLLKQLGQRLAAKLPPSHVVGPWGGTEWLVICPDPVDTATLVELANCLCRLIHQDHPVGDLLLSIKARVGICQASRFEPERLIHQAALALPHGYSPMVQYYSETLEQQQRRRLRLQQALRGAGERGELELAFQPKVDLASGRAVGAEALLRWHHPDFGTVSPADFIPLAEASGDILAIGDWVIDAALDQLKAWRQEAWINEDFHLAINVAARQLSRQDFAERLLERLRWYDLPGSSLGLEVTESGLMVDVGLAREQLTILARAGTRIAIDDFGTGYSSLAYLKTLPVSTLKIDRAFVSPLPDSEEDRNLAATVIAMAHSFCCDVVAEGIEQASQATLLRELGFETAQGYYYSRPLPPEAFADWHRQQQAAMA